MAKGDSLKVAALRDNNQAYANFFDRLFSIAISRFEYINVPPGFSVRELEMNLIQRGSCAAFYDDLSQLYLTLPFNPSEMFDVYGNPTEVQIFSHYNGFHITKRSDEISIFYNNYQRLPILPWIDDTARRLAKLLRTVDVNVSSQKTPVVISGLPEQALTMKNAGQKLEGFEHVLYVSNKFSMDQIKAVVPSVTLVAPEIWYLLQNIWNDALVKLGVFSTGQKKSFTANSVEAASSLGATSIHRMADLAPRIEAVENFNRLFGTDVTVQYRNIPEEDLMIGGVINYGDLHPDSTGNDSFEDSTGAE